LLQDFSKAETGLPYQSENGGMGQALSASVAFIQT
jgi:hypothetical protein